MLVASHLAAVCTGRCCHGAVAAAAACLPMWQEPGMGHDSSESSARKALLLHAASCAFVWSNTASVAL